MVFLTLVRKYAWCVLFSVLISSCLFTHINKIADDLLPVTDVRLTITTPNKLSEGQQVWLYLIDGKEISMDFFESMPKTGDWRYMSTEDGAGNNTIIGIGTGSTITIPINKSCSGGFSIWMNAISSCVDIEMGDQNIHYDFYSKEGKNIQITPFEDSLISIPVRALLYSAVIVVITVLLILLYKFIYLFSSGIKEPNYQYPAVVAAIFIFTYIFDVIWYKQGIINFNAFGDQPGYWNVGGIFAQRGLTKEIIEETAKGIPCFRGYGIFLPSFIARFIGNRLNVDSYIVYFALPSLVAAFLFGYILPKIYELIHAKKVSIMQIIFAYISFFIFYKGNLVSIDGDLFGMVFYLAGSLFVILFVLYGKNKYSILSGIFFSLSLAVRTSYLIGVGIVLIIAIAFLVMICIKKKTIYTGIIYNFTFKRVILSAISFAASFLFFCIPQIYINVQQGHAGLFAYDKDGVYATQNTTLLEQGVDYALRGWITGYPSGIFDDQIHSIRQNAGYMEDKELTMAQGLDAYAKKPLDTLVAIAKRLFAFVDIKFNVTLPAESWSANSKYYLFSTLNYLFLATATFCIFNKRARELVLKKNDFLLWGILLAGPIAPMLAARLEWRQAMLLYLFYLSYASSYCFVDGIVDKEKRPVFISNRYLSFVTVFVFACHAVSLTMYN